MKILITGDSFSADWTKKYTGQGWPNLLAQQHNVVNLSQAGCGEYKIYQQLAGQDFSNYDCVIVSHTSPYRIHTMYHPVHNKDQLHHNSDFIYEDVKAHGLTGMTEYFEKYFDLDYAKFVHHAICNQIDQLTKSTTVLHIAHIDWSDLYPFELLNFQDIYKKHSGLLNHYSDHGNQIVAKEIEKRLVSYKFL